MPTIIGNQFLNYRDLMSGLKGDKSFDSDIVELMVQQTPMLDDMVISEANDGTTNRTTVRTGLPDATWRRFYKGVQASKGAKQQIRNTAGWVGSKLEIDAELYDNAPTKDAKSALLFDEVSQHCEVLSNEMQAQLIYGSLADNPDAFNGLMNTYSEVGSSGMDDRVASNYVFSGAKASSPSTSALRSILLVGWAQKSIRTFYPQGTKGGLRKGEFKKVDVVDASNGGTYEAYRQYFNWTLGLDVRDYRYAGRIANIESDYMLATSGQPDYVELVNQLVARVRGDGVRQVFYMHKRTWEDLRILLARKTMTNAIQKKDVMERPTQTLYDIPVRFCDAMNVNEAFVS